MSVEYEKNPDPLQPCRLAFRTEVDVVNCYLVLDTMQLQKRIGMIDRRSLDEDPPLFDEWKALMTGHLLRWIKAQGLNVDKILVRDAPDGPLEPSRG